MFRRFLIQDKKTDGSGDGAGTQEPDKKTSQEEDESDKEDSEEKEEGEEELDISKLDPKAQKLVSDLRKENANARVKNKALAESHNTLKKALIDVGMIEDDSDSPEEKVKQLSGKFENAQIKNFVLESAIEYGVGKEDYKYFQFLVAEKLGSLEENQELTEEEMKGIATEARGRSGGGSSATSVTGGKERPNPKNSGNTSVADFVSMNITQKSELFQKNPDLYNKLFAEAKSKKLLFK